MTNFIITYDLNQSGQNYTDLINKIKTFSNVHAMQSVWFIKSNQGASDIFNQLKVYIDDNDYLFVSEVNNNRQGWMKKEVWNFLDSI